MKKRNICQCTKCGDIIESKHVHDFVRCSCGAIFTDGGTQYIRRGFNEKGDFRNLTKDEIESWDKKNGMRNIEKDFEE